MEQSKNQTSPIAGEPAVLKHIGYALDLVSKLLDMMNNPEAYYLDSEAVAVDDLVNLQHHLVNAKWSVPRVSFHEGAVTVSTVEWEDEPAPSIADELEAADLEGWN
jgi:hypothetical protein